MWQKYRTMLLNPHVNRLVYTSCSMHPAIYHQRLQLQLINFLQLDITNLLSTVSHIYLNVGVMSATGSAIAVYN